MLHFHNIRVENLPDQMQRDVVRAVIGSIAGAPVSSISGTHRPRGVVISRRGNTHSVKPYRKPPDPETGEQLIQRGQLGSISQQWALISAAQRNAWKEYAKEYRAPLGMSAYDPNPGYNCFSKIQQLRLKSGYGFSADAPEQMPPRTADEILQAPSASPTTFRFVINHSIADNADMHVLFEITPPTKNVNCRPLDKHFTYIRGLNPASFRPLQQTGALYTLPDARHTVNAGERYGVRIRLLNAEFVTSAYTANDLIRE